MKEKLNSLPDYKMIFTDIIRIKYPEKEYLIESFLKKKKLSSFDIIKVNKLIFPTKKNQRKYRCYKKNEILKILEYQENHQLTNRDLAHHFKISPNTITSWRKKFRTKNKEI